MTDLFSFLPPNHLVNHTGVTLDEFHNLGADVFVDIVWHRDAVVFVAYHLYGYIYGLKEVVFVDAGKDEAAFVKGFRSLGAGADADGRERVAYTGKEGTFFGQSAGVGHYTEGVHLEAVVVVEAEGFLTDYSWVQLEA